jgi:O-antigen ligase
MNKYAIPAIASLVILQVYIPVAGSLHITLWFIFLLLFPIYTLVAGLPSRAAIRNVVFISYAVLCAVFSIASIFSPRPGMGVRMIVFLGFAGLAFLLGHRLGRKGRGPYLLRWLIIAAVPFGILNVLFVISPALEAAFLTSPIARILLEPDSLHNLMIPNLGNNVLDLGKAGTLFINANVASIFFGMLLIISVVSWRQEKRLGSLGAAMIFALAVLATGSRAGITALIGTAVVSAGVYIRRRGIRRSIVPITLALLVSSVLLFAPLSRFAIGRIVSAREQLDARWLLWYHGLTLLRDHPLVGVGFGGWEQSYPGFAATYGLEPTLPPHNAYLIAWLWGGLAGFLALMALIVGSAVGFWKKTRDRAVLHVGLGGCAILMWVGIQVFFTNFAIIETRIGATLFLVLGVLMGWITRYRSGESVSSRGARAVQPFRDTGTVPVA